jgi:hypothetical protein
MISVPIAPRQRRYMRLLFMAICGLAAGCGLIGQRGEPYIPLSLSEATQAAMIAQEFWRANAALDSECRRSD